MNFYGQNWKIWIWTKFIYNKTALRATQVAKSSVFWVKSFQAEWFLETAIAIGRRDHLKDKVYADVPQSIQELKEKIRAVIDNIEP